MQWGLTYKIPNRSQHLGINEFGSSLRFFAKEKVFWAGQNYEVNLSVFYKYFDHFAKTALNSLECGHVGNVSLDVSFNMLLTSSEGI